jgi:hypothetical protein
VRQPARRVLLLRTVRYVRHLVSISGS